MATMLAALGLAIATGAMWKGLQLYPGHVPVREGIDAQGIRLPRPGSRRAPHGGLSSWQAAVFAH